MSELSKRAFKQATDAVVTRVRVTLADVAARFGVEPGSLSRWRRRGPKSPPPHEWPETVAALAEETAAALHKEAARLERLASDLNATHSSNSA